MGVREKCMPAVSLLRRRGGSGDGGGSYCEKKNYFHLDV